MRPSPRSSRTCARAATRRCSSTRGGSTAFTARVGRGARGRQATNAAQRARRLPKAGQRERSRRAGRAHPRTITNEQRAQSWMIREADGNELGQRVTPLDRVGIYVPGRQGRVSVVGADERDAGEGRRRRRDRDGRADARRRAQSARARRGASVRRRSRVHDRRRAGDRRARLRHRDRSGRRQDRAVPATPTSPRRSAACSASSASTWSPGRRRSSSSPTARPTPTGSRWISSRRPSTTSSRRRSCSRPTRAFIDAVAASIERQLASHAAPRGHRGVARAPRRADRRCAISTKRATIANRIAPEHLELAVADPDALLAEDPPRRRDLPRPLRVRGARRLLRRAPTTCCRPSRTARFSSPLGVYDFQKRSSVLRISRAGARDARRHRRRRSRAAKG